MRDYLYTIHLITTVSLGYGVWIFYKENQAGHNRFTYSFLLVLLAALLGEIVAITLLLGFWSDHWNEISDAVQVTIFQLSLLFLAYTSITLNREQKKADEAKQRKKPTTTAKAKDSQPG